MGKLKRRSCTVVGVIISFAFLLLLLALLPPLLWFTWIALSGYLSPRTGETDSVTLLLVGVILAYDIAWLLLAWIAMRAFGYVVSLARAKNPDPVLRHQPDVVSRGLWIVILLSIFLSLVAIFVGRTDDGSIAVLMVLAVPAILAGAIKISIHCATSPINGHPV
ncbi:hypothetical protein [Jiella marina]|uniref:hypothetical protein n=1 Tax=Jiella sp. LLJ827 TaxID=2917712 RepID=UPI002100B296|nr:hypothetical protein [Jiella sp. LLJ827]MCQ0987231.1 hypothetical protein [Jiella sp. LLJ827]